MTRATLVLFGIAAALTLPLMAAKCESGMAPTVHMCKSYATVEQCGADVTCVWKNAEGCKAK